MWTEVARLALGATLLAGAAGGCVEGKRAPQGGDADAGVASEALVPAYCILNAHTDDWTVHFQGPNWLLSSSEGLGPQDLDVRIQHLVQPAISASGSFQLDAARLSEAVGYSVAGLEEVIGGARRTVPSFTFERLEAYAAYQRTIWEIHDASCGVLLGTGATFRPVGTFFRVVSSSDTRLPDAEVILVGPVGVDPDPVPVVPIGPGPAPAPPPGAIPDPGAPASAGDAGATDGR